ncbi:MAG TPA: DUF6580 family putative transport protein [Candidatus Saccharimonadales bacterium]|nr:DUF6580 family putative transport protein [Candidatus Saccharimonadales bacterium]
MKWLLRSNAAQIALVILLVALAAVARLVPHPANFAPVMAVAIFGGAQLPRRWAVIVPVVAMAASDLIIGVYDWRIMFTVWACYGITAYVSSRWLRRLSVARGAVLTLAASCFFFVVTNFAVWAAGGMYAHTWQGLASCYYFALPFFRNTLLSDAAYTVLLFGLWRLAGLAAGTGAVRAADVAHKA